MLVPSWGLRARSEDYRLWIWRSSLTRQESMGWPRFGADVRDSWKAAFREAEKYAAVKPRIKPTVAKERRGLSLRGSHARKVGFLEPGTVVWTALEDCPVRLAGALSLLAGKRRL
jgi:hypothetical protein